MPDGDRPLPDHARGEPDQADGGQVVRVVDNAEAERYEIRVGDSLAGFTTYRDRPGVRVLLHSEVFPAFEHHGVGATLARGALDDIRERNLKVVPRCPFVARYIKEHREYQDLVTE